MTKLILFKTYVLCFIFKFPEKIYCLMIDKDHAICNSNLNIFCVIKLLKLNFLWIISAIFLLNKTRDFYRYSHFFYNENWFLTLEKEFNDLDIIKKFSNAFIIHKKLELFNSIHIHWLVIQNHIPSLEAAITISMLLWLCMIWRTINDEINNVSIHNKISSCHINVIVLTFNKNE